MFGISFFSNRVASELFQLGHTPEELNALGQKNFKYLCDGLKFNDYDAKSAASLFDRFLRSDRAAFDELYKNSGLHGVTILHPLKVILEGADKDE